MAGNFVVDIISIDEIPVAIDDKSEINEGRKKFTSRNFDCNSKADIKRKISSVGVVRGSTYVSKLVVEKEVLCSLPNLIALPSDEFCLERFQNRRSWACAVDENQAEASRWMFQAEAGQHVGTKIHYEEKKINVSLIE